MANYDAYLRTNLSKYKHAELAKKDILTAIQQYKNLSPKLDEFTFNDGTKREMLCLDGTIPVTYRGSTYNIPVCLWLLDTHPYNPPIVYVKPTPTMQIKPGKHVDTNGRIYLPYLHDWRYPQSDIFGLIQILVIVFSEEPPVFSKSQAPQQRPSYFQPGAAGLPYPTSTSAMPMPGQPGYNNPTYGGYPPQSQPPYPMQQQSAQPPYPPVTNTYMAQSSAQPGLSDEQIRASLMSAVEDKLRRRLREVTSQANAELEVLRKTHDELEKGKQNLEDMLQKLEREQREVETNLTILREKNTEIKTAISKMENRENVSIDEAIVPAAPLYKQLLNAFAEEQAIEDAIYYFGEALQKDAIDAETFLKNVRELSRRQFMLRTLVQKCREKAGLPEL